MTEIKHKVGIIGAGVIADFHAQALLAMQGVELVAAYARNQEKADSFSQKYGCSGYSDLTEFLKHPGMDVVTIGSVSGVHLEHATAAAKSGKHIICEKPLEVTPSRIDEMIKVCEENSVMLSGIFPGDSMIPPIFSKKPLIQADLEKWFFVILQSNGGGRRNIMIAGRGRVHRSWMAEEL